MLIVFILIVCVAYILCYYTQKSNRYKLPPVLPGWLPIIGHNLILLGSLSDLWSTATTFAEHCNKLGGVTYCTLGFYTHYVITDPDDALTASNACLEKHFSYDYLKAWLGNGLVTAPVDIWKRHRKLMMPTLSLPVINTFLELFNDRAEDLVKEFACNVGNGQFSYASILKKMGLQTFCLTALEVDPVQDADLMSRYLDSAEKMGHLVTSRFQKPWLQSDLIFKLLGLRKKQNEVLRVFNQMSDEIIQRKKKDMEQVKNNKKQDTLSAGKTYKTLLHLLLELASDGSLSDTEIRDEIDTAIAAGFDTSSNTLVCVLTMIGAHPDVQQRMYDEIIQVVGPERNVTKDDLKKLDFLEAVILETLRIFPTAPVLTRRVDTDVKLKNYTMRAGTYCVILSIGLHHRDSWGDHLQFRPGRWLNDDNLPRNSFVGFSLGKRGCIGQTYAMTSMKINLVHFLRKYKIQSSEDNMTIKIAMTLQAESTIAISYRTL